MLLLCFFPIPIDLSCIVICQRNILTYFLSGLAAYVLKLFVLLLLFLLLTLLGRKIGTLEPGLDLLIMNTVCSAY